MIAPVFLALLASALALSPPSSRTTPPSGAKIVRAGTTTSGEFATLVAAVAALPSDSSSQIIFMYPGTYTGQVLIQRSGPIMGYTTSPSNYTSNQVTITASATLVSAGSDDASGTLRIHTDNVALYNLNIRNDHGSGVQAIALSNYGNKVGVYACQLVGYQDTLLTEQGLHVYLQSYIQGAVDFIFGQHSQAYFEGNTIAVSGPGCITASGRAANDAGIYLFSQNKIILASGAVSSTNSNIYLGRPWANYARVVWKTTTVTAGLNVALWKEWSSSTPNTDHVTFDDYQTTGSGIPSSLKRPSWAMLLSSSQASSFTLSSTLSGTTSWIDSNYLI
ncbi:pectinesterase [Vararia minispora EC-137]|uniref:Pectinesterase n=1 Tax=Vararia minispora EC-137 TaxID=1314806 RepID=A0ACB8QIL2_9AGAM|nr:pectinesterase [Vararia minispora EC-137]